MVSSVDDSLGHLPKHPARLLGSLPQQWPACRGMVPAVVLTELEHGFDTLSLTERPWRVLMMLEPLRLMIGGLIIGRLLA